MSGEFTIPKIILGERRPWGEYVVHEVGSGYAVKTLRVRPGQQLSVQKHKKRDELWVLVEGDGDAGFGNPPVWQRLQLGHPVRILRGELHSLRGGPSGLVLIEVMLGVYDEADNERISDIYGRA